MNLLIDTNIILDVLCNRKDFLSSSALVCNYCETRKITGYVSAISIPNIVYILRKELDPDKTKEIIDKLFSIFNIADLKAEDLKKAAAIRSNDYEDALQMVCASSVKADYIITRNIKDFVNSNIRAITPDEFLKNM